VLQWLNIWYVLGSKTIWPHFIHIFTQEKEMIGLILDVRS
jgi:hypothetical protein